MGVIVLAICTVLAMVAIALTSHWIIRDHKKAAAVKLKPMPTPTVVCRLDEAETLMNKRMEELTDLHERSISKGLKFDPNYKKPDEKSSDVIDLKNDELRKLRKAAAGEA